MKVLSNTGGTGLFCNANTGSIAMGRIHPGSLLHRRTFALLYYFAYDMDGQ